MKGRRTRTRDPHRLSLANHVTGRRLQVFAVMLLPALFGCVERTSTNLSEHWRVVWERSPFAEAGGHHPFLYRGRTLVAENTYTTRFIGGDCVVFSPMMGGDSNWYTVCGPREPVPVFPSTWGKDALGAGGFEVDEERSGPASFEWHRKQIISFAEAKRRAMLQPGFRKEWHAAPDCSASPRAAVACGRDPSPGNVAGFDLDHRTILHDAILWRRLELVPQLIAAGADVGAADRHGRTPLMEAGALRNRDAIEVLLRAGADVNAADARGTTALMNVAGGTPASLEIPAAAIVRRLLEAGADPNRVDASGWPALRYAAERGDDQVYAVLAEASSLPIRQSVERIRSSRQHAGELVAAVQDGRTADVTRLLDQGVDVNGRDSNGGAPLETAIAREQFDVARLLLARGADANVTSRGSKVTPLMRGTMTGLPDDLARIMIARADVNMTDEKGATALTYAAQSDRTALAVMLLDRGANPNVREADGGETPLLIAATRGNLELVRSLAAHGADLGARDRDGLNAIDRERVFVPPHPAIEAFLRSRGISEAFFAR